MPYSQKSTKTAAYAKFVSKVWQEQQAAGGPQYVADLTTGDATQKIRGIHEPLLAELGLGPNVVIQVHVNTANVYHIVVPAKPGDLDGLYEAAATQLMPASYCE